MNKKSKKNRCSCHSFLKKGKLPHGFREKKIWWKNVIDRFIKLFHLIPLDYICFWNYFNNRCYDPIMSLCGHESIDGNFFFSPIIRPRQNCKKKIGQGFYSQKKRFFRNKKIVEMVRGRIGVRRFTLKNFLMSLKEENKKREDDVQRERKR